MLKTIWTTLLYQPLYNLLILFIALMPGGNVGLAVIVLTVLVKIILFPLAHKSIVGQMRMKALEPEVAELKKSITDKVEQNKKIYELYKEKKVNPFSSCLLLLVQFPVIIALYYVFLRGFGEAPVALYSFVTHPETLNMNFLGVDLAAKNSILMAILVGVSQFVQGRLMQGRQGKPSGEGMQAQIAKSMQVQMLVMLPLMLAGFTYFVFPAAIALYWTISNVFTIVHEIYVARKYGIILPPILPIGKWRNGTV